MVQPGVGRTGHLAGVGAQVGQHPAALAEKTLQAGLPFPGIVPGIQHAEIAVPHRIVHELAAPLRIRRTQEILLLQAEVEPHRLHRRRREPAHPQMPQRGHHGAPVRRRQHPQDVVIVHHLPHPQAAFQVVVEHVRQAVNGIEPGVRDGQRHIGPDGRLGGQIPLQAGVQEGIVHLAGVEMDLDLHVVEEIGLAFLVEDAMDLAGRGQRLQDGFVRPLDPNVDIAAHPPLRERIQVREDGPLEKAGVKAQPLQDAGELRHALLVQAVDARDLVGQAGPAVQDVQRRELLLRKARNPFIADSDQGLIPRHPEHHFPAAPGRSLLQRRFPAQGDE